MLHISSFVPDSVHSQGQQVACEQALSCGVGGWREEERELAIMFHKFAFLHPKSGREMLIG